MDRLGESAKTAHSPRSRKTPKPPGRPRERRPESPAYAGVLAVWKTGVARHAKERGLPEDPTNRSCESVWRIGLANRSGESVWRIGLANRSGESVWRIGLANRSGESALRIGPANQPGLLERFQPPRRVALPQPCAGRRRYRRASCQPLGSSRNAATSSRVSASNAARSRATARTSRHVHRWCRVMP